MGSPDFAVPSLDALHKTPHEIVTVVSGADKRRRRRGEPEPTPVKKRALELRIPVLEAEDMKDSGLRDKLKSLAPDLFVVVAFKILPPALLAIPEKGSINLHASLLPKYRGAAPIHWAVINGETETGCTVFFLDKDVDTGKILKQKRVPVGQNDTTGDIYNLLKSEGAELITECVDQISKGDCSVTIQQDLKATPAPKLFRENTRIDFSKPASDIHNLVRGLNPFPVAWCMYDEDKMNIYKTKVGPERDIEAGELLENGDRLLAGTGKGTVELLELQLPGRKRMSGSEFTNGYDLSLKLK